MIKNCSSDIGSFDSIRSKFFAKVMSSFRSFSLNEYDLQILSSVFSDRNIWSPGQRAEILERIASESLQKIRMKFYEVAGHVGRVKTVVTNHLRKMFRSRIHKAAERNDDTAATINSGKLTETNSGFGLLKTEKALLVKLACPRHQGCGTGTQISGYGSTT